MSAYHHQPKGRIRPCTLVFSLLIVVFSVFIPAHSGSHTNKIQPTINNPSNLVKLGAAGEVLSLKAQQWSCVKDQQTGLFWQKHDPSSALHGHDTFTWYQPEQVNSGSQRAHPDLDWADTTCFGFNPNDTSSFCNSSAYAERVNQSNYCGYSDWRLPTSEELLTLVDSTRVQQDIRPRLDTRFFPFNDAFLFWTSTINNDDVVVTIFRDDMILETSERDDKGSIRLVRGQ